MYMCVYVYVYMYMYMYIYMYMYMCMHSMGICICVCICMRIRICICIGIGICICICLRYPSCPPPDTPPAVATSMLAVGSTGERSKGGWDGRATSQNQSYTIPKKKSFKAPSTMQSLEAPKIRSLKTCLVRALTYHGPLLYSLLCFLVLCFSAYQGLKKH